MILIFKTTKQKNRIESNFSQPRLAPPQTSGLVRNRLRGVGLRLKKIERCDDVAPPHLRKWVRNLTHFAESAWISVGFERDPLYHFFFLNAFWWVSNRLRSS